VLLLRTPTAPPSVEVHDGPSVPPCLSRRRRRGAARSRELTLDASRRNEWGDPPPKLAFRDAPESAALRDYSTATIRERFAETARTGGGTVLQADTGDARGWQDHPAGGCRRGSDPSTSVVGGWGRTHDHEHLIVAGAPTCVSASCANGTLAFCARALRSADAIAR
jgi:choline dehydrogenase-like flavoprotein